MEAEAVWPADGVAATLLVDATAARTLRALADHGIDAVLLKGSSFAFLYGDGTRTYDDVDVLVDPADHAAAGAVIEALGYRSLSEGVSPLEQIAHATTYVADDDPPVDLHHTLAGVGVGSGEAWAVLRAASTPHDVGGWATRALGRPACVLHVALHFAQSGPGHAKPADDLDRALDQVDEDTWRAAAQLASRLEATEAMAAALRWRSPAGRELADALGLPHQVSLALDIRRRTASPLANSLARVGETPGFAPKVRLLARLVVPTPAAIRASAPTGTGLPQGYLRHLRRSTGDLRRGLTELVGAARRRRRDQRERAAD